MAGADMNKATLKALRGSISKWKRIVAGTGGDDGVENCPLCQMFFYDHAECQGCPVSAKTGVAMCLKTPYEKQWMTNDWFWGQRASSPKLLRAAKAELKFLESLLPGKAKGRKR